LHLIFLNRNISDLFAKKFRLVHYFIIFSSQDTNAYGQTRATI